MIWVSPADLSTERVCVMGAADLVDDHQAFGAADADDRRHVADVEVNANPQRFAADVRHLSDDMFSAIEAVVHGAGGEVDELTIEIGA